MDRPSLGEQELEVLRFIAERAPVAAREVVEQFAEEGSRRALARAAASDSGGTGRGLARTTVLTVIERLRKKGYLTRKRRAGVFQYSPRVSQSDLLQGLVRQFVEKTLGGSVSPVVAYLAHTRHLSDAELAQLQQLVEELRAERREEEP